MTAPATPAAGRGYLPVWWAAGRFFAGGKNIPQAGGRLPAGAEILSWRFAPSEFDGEGGRSPHLRLGGMLAAPPQ